VTGDELHILRGHLVGNVDRLLRIASIVADFEFEPLAVYATGGIDVIDGTLRALAPLLAYGGNLTSDRTHESNVDVSHRVRRQQSESGTRDGKSCGNAAVTFIHLQYVSLSILKSLEINSFRCSS
jgi:hypothetical protein